MVLVVVGQAVRSAWIFLLARVEGDLNVDDVEYVWFFSSITNSFYPLYFDSKPHSSQKPRDAIIWVGAGNKDNMVAFQ